MVFLLRDLDLDRMTLMYGLYLDILKICLNTKINFLHQVFQKYEQDTVTQTNGQTDATERITAAFPRGNKTRRFVRH